MVNLFQVSTNKVSGRWNGSCVSQLTVTLCNQSIISLLCTILLFSNMTLVSLILNQPTSNVEGWTEYNVYGKREHFQFALVISPSAIKDWHLNIYCYYFIFNMCFMLFTFIPFLTALWELRKLDAFRMICFYSFLILDFFHEKSNIFVDNLCCGLWVRWTNHKAALVNRHVK